MRLAKLCVLALPLFAGLRAQADADLPEALACKAGDDDKKSFFLIGPRGKDKAPANGYRLLLVLAGGDGSAEFATFVRRIAANATDESWLVAHLVAPVWSKKQAEQVVWPTRTSKLDGVGFPTEEFIAAVIRDVERRHPVDPAQVLTLAWSSSGPAAYAASLDPELGVTGSFVAMSVWKPDQLPKLGKAKGHAYWLLHSPQDFIPIAMARKAETDLGKQGAKVELTEYEGGHGWRGDVYGMMRTGLAWLVDNHAKPTPARVQANKQARAGGGKDK